MLKGCTREVVLIASLKLDDFDRLKIKSLQQLSYETEIKKPLGSEFE